MIRVDHNCEYHLEQGGHPPRQINLEPADEGRSAEQGVPKVRIRKNRLRDGDPQRGVLFAGPWIGEFGWELARWQGAVRKCAAASGLYTIVMSDPGHQALYADFAHEFWELPNFFLGAVADGRLVRQCDHVRADNAEVLELLGALIQRELIGRSPEYLAPRKFTPSEQRIVPLTAPDHWSRTAIPPQMFRGYYCILPRLRAWNGRKNWPVANWRMLISRLTDLHMSPKTIGRPEEIRALIPQFEIEPKDQLARSIDLLTHAKFAIAQESGGALLSLLCGCPTLVFGHYSLRKRICETENFLGTRVKYLGGPNYNFTIQEVEEGARIFLRDL